MRRGDIHVVQSPGMGGRPGRGRQFAVVVHADERLPAPLILIVPSAQSARARSAGPLIDVEGQPTRLLVEMVGPIERRYLGDLVGHLTTDEQSALDTALSEALGLD